MLTYLYADTITFIQCMIHTDWFWNLSERDTIASCINFQLGAHEKVDYTRAEKHVMQMAAKLCDKEFYTHFICLTIVLFPHSPPPVR